MGKKATNICKYCNKEVVFGEHFCEKAFYQANRGKDKDVKPERRLAARRIVVVAISLILALSLLVASLGVFSFLPVVVAIPVWLVVLGVGKIVSAQRNSAYEKLLELVNGDESLAERLIAAEAKRDPELSRPDCAERAYDRLYAERSRHF